MNCLSCYLSQSQCQMREISILFKIPAVTRRDTVCLAKSLGSYLCKDHLRFIKMDSEGYKISPMLGVRSQHMSLLKYTLTWIHSVFLERVTKLAHLKENISKVINSLSQKYQSRLLQIMTYYSLFSTYYVTILK